MEIIAEVANLRVHLSGQLAIISPLYFSEFVSVRNNRVCELPEELRSLGWPQSGPM
jgi:hypothetical protein